MLNKKFAKTIELQERRRREAMSTGGDVTSQMDLMLNFEANF